MWTWDVVEVSSLRDDSPLVRVEECDGLMVVVLEEVELVGLSLLLRSVPLVRRPLGSCTSA